MAAYAALASLMHIIEQIQHHPSPPISLDENQVESLTGTITFLQKFLEDYDQHVRDKDLRSRIAITAHDAEDVIESHIVNRILDRVTSHGESNNPRDLFYQDLQKVIQDMDLIKEKVMEITEEMGPVQDHLNNRSSMPEAASSRLSSSTRKSIMVGFDDVLEEIMDKLTRNPDSKRQIIPIVGMGGMGKSTLAQNVYEHLIVMQHFDIRAWATVSQVYNVREILLQLILCFRRQDSRESLSQMSEGDLGEMLYKNLWGRRYLIVLDGMWSIEAWESVKLFFPNQNAGSGIIITSRLSKLAVDLTGGPGVEMKFLDIDTSFRLLCKIVFGEDNCPPELETTGRKIAENCNGLPLSLVVIGGLLGKSDQTPEYWEYIAQNLISVVNSENDAQCLNLLYLSYNHLPIHLKPCFLYFGVFSEDHEILVSELIKLWASEGFLKPISGKSLEQVAEEYLRDLIDRNLVLVRKWKYNGKVKLCKIHDLLRDLCLREAEEEKFLCVTRQHSHNIVPHGLNTYRRIAIHQNMSRSHISNGILSSILCLHIPAICIPFIRYFYKKIFNTRDMYLEHEIEDKTPFWNRGSQPHQNVPNEKGFPKVRSFICNFREDLQSLDFRLLSVLKVHDQHSLEAIFSEVVNLRFVDICLVGVPNYLKFPSSIYLFWNLHTLIVGDYIKTILDIGKMPQLRHVKIWRLHIGNSSSDQMHGQGGFVLKNLQTLKVVENFKCSKRMVKTIPNIKKLGIYYSAKRFIESYYCLNNLAHLQKLENLSCSFKPMMEPIGQNDLLQNLTLPCSLKKLTLTGSRLHWEDISTRIGSLLDLQVLKLKWDSVIGPKWETVEERFRSLKFLEIDSCPDLKWWETDNTHFPCLEQLVLVNLRKLEEIPTSIGDIPTLQLIKIERCSDSAVISAKQILVEQEEFGNDDLQVRAVIRRKNEQVQCLASNNFLVQVADFYD